jgi:signal transduction histidine kinase
VFIIGKEKLLSEYTLMPTLEPRGCGPFMNPERLEPLTLEFSPLTGSLWVYPWIGLLVGAGAGVLVGHPITMVVQNLHDALFHLASFRPDQIFLDSFSTQFLPLKLLYAIPGGTLGAILGVIFRRLKGNRLRLDALNQDFELQVGALRHHYKNLTIGIEGFSKRIKRNMVKLDEMVRHCASDECLTHARYHADFESLANNVGILEETAQRLNEKLVQEVRLLKALTTDTIKAQPREFYTFLKQNVQELIDLRFQEKRLRVEINGRPLEECSEHLAFPFEPYSMDIILQNILSNAMKAGDHIRIDVGQANEWVRVMVWDNGPGLELEKLKGHLLTPWDRQAPESTHLGLKVSLNLLQRSGGHMAVGSQPGAGTVFALDFSS